MVSEQMQLLNETSLAETIDAINEAVFFGRKLSKADKVKTAGWIAGRFGQPNSYSGLFAPTANDMKTGIKVFTGEPVKSRAGSSHIIGEEACCAIMLLGAPNAAIRKSLAAATEGFTLALARHAEMGGTPGMFCCGICSAALWRNLQSGAMNDALGGEGSIEKRLSDGMKALTEHRNPDGKWRRFPFWYTVLALSGIDKGLWPKAAKLARAEIGYIAPILERAVSLDPGPDKYAIRRHTLAIRALGG